MGMSVYTDLISGDEIISSSYDLIDKDDVVYEVDCAMVSKGGETYDIGANASAEGGGDDEGVEDAVQKVNNVVDAFRLNAMEGAFPTKKDYTAQFKGYLKKVVAKWKEEGKSEDEIKKLQAGISNYFSKVITPNFKDYEFFSGESMDTDGMILLLNYREDGITPYFTIWKHALKEVRH